MFKKFFVIGNTFLLILLTPLSALAQINTNSLSATLLPTASKRPSYSKLMRDFEITRRQSRSVAVSPRAQITQDLQTLRDSESDRLDEFSIPSERKKAYLRRLELMARAFSTEKPSLLKRVMKKVKKAVGLDNDQVVYDADRPKSVRQPAKPARFDFNNKPVLINSLKDTVLYPEPGRNISSLLKKIKATIKVQPVSAEEVNPSLPVLADIKADNGEVVITGEMIRLARELKNNPVEILNFVKENIQYEPYFGAKKGALGCLVEKFCNDTDASSLTISLLRAAGIPARYKKSIAVFSMVQLKNLLGVTDANTVYAAFYLNSVPVYTISGNPLPKNLDDADLSGEQYLALEWNFVQVFYDYDERGGNISNQLNLNSASTTVEVQTILGSAPKKQWISLDPIIQPYLYTQKEIVHDTANFNTESFYYGFLQYQGDLSPMDKYAQDLKIQTSKDINSDAFKSTRTPLIKKYGILPPTLPYVLGSGVTGGQTIEPETWSVLPDSRRYQLTISLKTDQNNIIVLNQNFWASEINNQTLDLAYNGFTEADNAVIDSYGGIHATPAELAMIKPIFQNEVIRSEGVIPLTIGQSLILQFVYKRDGKTLYSDEKFSTAGNQEGIFVTFSQVASNSILDDISDPNRNSKLLLEGNGALGREYLRVLLAKSETLGKSLDYRHMTNFARAVVTQNRVLNTVNGVPTTFDFKGLTIDVASFINDYSNRGNYKNHRKDFRLLWGEFASYYEGQLFEDIAGLESISTVKGLQYAYAHPEAYTVHTITSANESIIDTLNLSVNTKQNMHVDVQAGKTIITPNTFVTDGNWNGAFYISLDPVWTGTYAIGEQVTQNGGFSVDQMQVAGVFDGNFMKEYFFAIIQTTTTKKYFGYQDMKESTDSVVCSLLEPAFLSIQNDPKWKTEYGWPCAKETKTFGLVEHTYILASNAAKFYSANKYDYWVKRPKVIEIIKTQTQNFDGSKFKFNPIAGTYSYNASYAVYYQPVQPTVLTDGAIQENGKAWKVSGDILEKLMKEHYEPTLYYCNIKDNYCAKKNWVLNKLGYPTESQKTAAESLSGTDGYYQTFVGGQVYVETEWSNESYYVPGQITETFNSSEYAVGGQVGTGGQFGFPLSDPEKNGNIIYQNFENGYRIASTGSINDNSFTISVEKDYSSSEFKDLMIDGFVDAFTEVGVYGLAVNFGAGIVLNEAIQLITKQAVTKLGKKAAIKVGVRFVPYVGWVIGGLTVAASIDQNLPLYKACSEDPYLYPPNPILDGAKPAYYCGKLGGSAILVGLGFMTDYAAGKLNKLYVSTNQGRMGKNEIFSNITDSAKGKQIQKSFETNYKTRDKVSELAERLDQADIERAVNDPKLIKRLLEDDIYFTFINNAKNLGRYDHIFFGDKSGGWHYYPTGKNKVGNEILEIIETDPTTGVYKARVKINGVEKPTPSTFFPDSWSEEKVLKAINSAFNNKKYHSKSNVPSNDIYRATIEGVEIEMYVEIATGKLVSVFPASTIQNGF